MIGRPELERRAATLGIGPRHVELDYVLNHLLAQIAKEPGDLVFRGGTALARVYWPDFRISEDLDFIGAGPLPELGRLLRRAVLRAADETGLELQVAAGPWRDDRARNIVRWTTPWGVDGELLIDVVRHERARLPIEARALHLAYSDLNEAGAAVPVLDLCEILANKWLMLDDRNEPRDLFDLWWGLERQNVDFDRVAAAHRVAYGYAPPAVCIDRAARLERGWQQRLAHQMPGLPPFHEALSAIRKKFESWAVLPSCVQRAVRP